MLTLKELRWSNLFSYGEGNVVNFTANPLTQLVGKNGHGKSSIALILEEALFNKNSKGIKKADILNRYVKDKSYSIELDFDKDGAQYSIHTKRGSTQTVKLLKNGTDISAHTSSGTYKMIEDILGLDHKSFCQIVYQSSANSLEFLTAPDTARKKFLIEILNLTQYTKAQEVFKKAAQDLEKDVAATQAKVNTVSSWLIKYQDFDTTPMPVEEVPELPDALLKELAATEQEINNIEATSAKITKNNTYKKLQEQAESKLVPVPKKPVEDPTLKALEISAVREKTIHEKTITDSKTFVNKLRGLSGKCPTCLQDVNVGIIDAILEEQTALRNDATAKLQQALENLDECRKATQKFQEELVAWKTASEAQESWERYYQLIDTTLPSVPPDKHLLQEKLAQCEQQINKLRTAISQAQAHNKKAQAHNAQVEVVAKQLVEMATELEQHGTALAALNEQLSIFNILLKTFSTTGLVAYKIECLVKDLEELTNHYLVDLSDGRFQISFKVTTSDKLSVIITDNGRDIEITALSGGERARVNAAALLAIRKLMQTLSSNRVNLLILDETVDALDVDGKDKLVEVLLKEDFLNTFLVSHGFTHPLLEKINIVKRNNISRIEV